MAVNSPYMWPKLEQMKKDYKYEQPLPVPTQETIAPIPVTQVTVDQSQEKFDTFAVLTPNGEQLVRLFIPNDCGDNPPVFANNHWTGYLTSKNFDYNGNWMTLSPLPPGEMSAIQGLLLYATLFRLGKEQPEVFRGIIADYLSTISSVVQSINAGSEQHPITGLTNTYRSAAIFERLGLISPRDATQLRAWTDNIMNTMLKITAVGEMGLGTLVAAGAKAVPNLNVGKGK